MRRRFRSFLQALFRFRFDDGHGLSLHRPRTLDGHRCLNDIVAAAPFCNRVVFIRRALETPEPAHVSQIQIQVDSNIGAGLSAQLLKRWMLILHPCEQTILHQDRSLCELLMNDLLQLSLRHANGIFDGIQAVAPQQRHEHDAPCGIRHGMQPRVKRLWKKSNGFSVGAHGEIGSTNSTKHRQGMLPVGIWRNTQRPRQSSVRLIAHGAFLMPCICQGGAGIHQLPRTEILSKSTLDDAGIRLV